MAVSQQIPYNEYVGNGSATSFSYTFKLLQTSDLKVFVDNVLQVANYTVSNVGNPAGGSVTFAIAPTNGSVVRIARDSPVNRTTDYTEGSSFSSTTVDDDLDRVVMLIQEIDANSFGLSNTGVWDFQSKRATNLGAPTAANDAATKAYVDNKVFDHGQLTGLGDDDHTQYLNVDRGDGRYYTKNQLETGAIDSRYYTAANTQSLLDLKAPLASPTFTGTVVLPSSTTIGTVSSGEIAYLDGVTSSIQGQIDGKAATAHSHVAANITDFNTQAATVADSRAGVTLQGAAPNLTGISGASGFGLYVRTGSDTATTRTLTAGSSKLTITNGDGVAGNPIINFGSVSINDLSDVTVTSPISGHALIWNGSDWINGTVAVTGLATGGTTGQVLAKKSNTDYDAEWVNPPSGGTWGSITGTLSSQTDLQTALNLKAPLASPTFTGTVNAPAYVVQQDWSGIDFKRTDGRVQSRLYGHTADSAGLVLTANPNETYQTYYTISTAGINLIRDSGPSPFNYGFWHSGNLNPSTFPTLTANNSYSGWQYYSGAAGAVTLNGWNQGTHYGPGVVSIWDTGAVGGIGRYVTVGGSGGNLYIARTTNIDGTTASNYCGVLNDAGSWEFSNVTIGSNQVWHAGNFNPSTKQNASTAITTANIGTQSVNYANYSGYSERMNYQDTRAVNFAPRTYAGVTFHFKTNTTDGLSDGGTYHGVLDFSQWSDNSGGKAHQIGLTDNESLWHRHSDTAGTGWNSWRKVWDSVNFDPATKQDAGVAFTSSTSGVVPSSGGGTTNFLRADGTWAAPPSGGSLALDNLTDVVITTPSTGQVLKFNGTNWINDTDATGGGGGSWGTITGTLSSQTDLQTALDAKAPTASPTFTGVATFASGSNSAPSITFAGDTNTGIYSDAADEVKVAAQGLLTVRARRASTSVSNPEHIVIEGGSTTSTSAVRVSDGGLGNNVELRVAAQNTADVGLGAYNTAGTTFTPYFYAAGGTGTQYVNIINNTTETFIEVVASGANRILNLACSGTAATTSGVKLTTWTGSIYANLFIASPLATITGVQNYINVYSSNSGSHPTIEAEGGDANINLDLFGKGTGSIRFNGTATTISSAGALSTSQLITATGGLTVSTGNITLSTTGTISATNSVISSTRGFASVQNNAGNSATAITVNWQTGANQLVTLTDNATITLSNPASGAMYKLIINTGTGGFTRTFSPAIRWPGGTTPTWSTGASQVDIITLYWDGSNYYGTASTNFA